MRLFDVKKGFGPVPTTDGTIETILSFDLVLEFPSLPVDNFGMHAEAVLVAKDASNNVTSLRFARGFKRIAGTLSALGTQASVVGTGIGDGALSTVTGTLDASGNAIRVRATGIAATNISWTGFLWICSSEF